MGTLLGLLVGALASTAASNWAVQVKCSCTQAGGALEKQAGGALGEQAVGASEEQAGGPLEKQAGGAFGGTGPHWEAHCDGADAPATNGPSSCLGAGLASRLGGASCKCQTHVPIVMVHSVDHFVMVLVQHLAMDVLDQLVQV